MKKLISMLLFSTMLLTILASCGEDTTSSTSSTSTSSQSSSSSSDSGTTGAATEFSTYTSTLPMELGSAKLAKDKATSLMGEDKNANDAIVVELLNYCDTLAVELNKSVDYTSEKLADSAIEKTINETGVFTVKQDEAGVKYINFPKSDLLFAFNNYLGEGGIAYQNQLRAETGVTIGSTPETTMVDWKVYSEHIYGWEKFISENQNSAFAKEAEKDLGDEMHYMFVTAEDQKLDIAIAEYKAYETNHPGTIAGPIMTKLYAEYEKNGMKKLPNLEQTLDTIGFYTAFPDSK